MKAILFNTHDLILLLTLGTCIFVIGFYTFRQNIPVRARYLLICFFALNGIIALDTLIFWGEVVKYRVFNFFPWFSLCFSFAMFAAGPVLYWYTKSRLECDFSLKHADILHLLPALAAPVYLYTVCFRFPPDVQRELMLEFQIYAQPGVYYTWFVNLKKLLPVIYAAFSAFAVFRYVFAERNSKTINIYTTWLQILVYGFLLLWLWVLITHLIGQYHAGELSDLMGISGNYLTFILISILVFYDQAYLTGNIKNVVNNIVEEKPEHTEDTNPEYLKRVSQIMETEKPFLNPRLTLERFAELVQLSPRQVSLIINRCFEQNFHEYINRYRVEEAKKMLTQPEYQTSSILTIAHLAGFNSKATFNRFFKNLVTVTPTEYREQYSTRQNRSHKRTE